MATHGQTERDATLRPRQGETPRWVDSHAHLYDQAYAEDIDRVIVRAKEAGVEAIVLPNCDTETLAPMRALAARYPRYCYTALGLHPTSVTPSWPLQIEPILRAQKDCPGLVAIGEIGLDRYWSLEHYGPQYEAFRFQLGWAMREDLPVLIHAREATDLTLEILEEPAFTSLRGVLHAFQGGEAQVQRALELPNLHIGLGGIATFKRGYAPGLLERIPPERVLLETDAPYLAPVPFRGARNESAHIPVIAAHLAQVWGIPLPEVASITTANAAKLFRLPHLAPSTQDSQEPNASGLQPSV